MASEHVHDPSDTHGHLIAASKVNGAAVYDAAGEKIGSVHDVMVEKVSGHAKYAVLSIGGFLGMGGQYHPIPWHGLTYDPSKGGFVVSLTKDRLQGAPAYSTSDLGSWDDHRGRHIDDYYGTAGARA